MDSTHCKKNAKDIGKSFLNLMKCLNKRTIHAVIVMIIFTIVGCIYFFFTKDLAKELFDSIKIMLSCAFWAPEDDCNINNNLSILILCPIPLLIGLYLSYSAIRSLIFPFEGKQRNADYLIKQMSSDDRRLPLVSIKQQIERIAGKGADIKTRTIIENRTNATIKPIKEFIINDEKALILDGKWGSGKTSYTLISINEISKHESFEKTDYRFIYESAFKYVSNFSEFKSDIIKVIQIILSEQNIFAPNVTSELINNLNKTSFHIPISTISGSVTTTDYIEKLNAKYTKRQKRNPKPFQIIIIIDDIDRLLGEDIVQTLSFLSVIRRIKFIKLIIPIDRSVVIGQLRSAKIIDPETYIKKHLPEESEIQIPTPFEQFEDLYSYRIRGVFGEELSEEQVQPILENICLKVFSERLKSNMKAVNIDSLGEWQSSVHSWPTELMQHDEYNSEYILQAKDVMRARIPQENNSQVSFHSGRNDEFEALVYKLKYKDKRELLPDGRNPLRVDMELYSDCLKSWIMPFSQNRWERVGVTMRTLDDIFENIVDTINKDQITPNTPPNLIFVRAFNALFPKWPILDENLMK